MTTATLDVSARTVRIPAGTAMLEADIHIPPRAHGVVLFASGSGMTRKNPRSRKIGASFNEASLATVLIDLLTPDEEHADSLTREFRFDIPLLANRLTAIIDWMAAEGDVGRLPLGLFGTGTGAAAALEAAARRPATIHAVVSRGGRPDLAGCLDLVRAPVLLVVGGADTAVLEFNRHSLHHLHAIRMLEIVPGATHFFEEHGAMERVTQLSRDWFRKYVAGDREDW